MTYYITFLFAYCICLNLLAQDADLADRLEKHVSFLSSDSLQGRGLGTSGKVYAMDYIAAQFQSIGLQTYDSAGYFQEIDLKLGLARVPAVNVIGWLKGSDPDLQKGFIVVGAHYDHLGYNIKNGEKEIFHGADDNASGVAAMIELARYFSLNPGLVKRSIIFIAFDAEESGLLGSNAFVKDNDRFEMSSIKAMFSLDMIGMYTPNHGLVMDGIGTLNKGEKLAESIAAEKNIILKRTTPNVGTRTDTWPFGEKGIPAVHMFTGVKSPYHKPGDTFEKLDYEGMELVVNYLTELITEISALPEIIPSNHFARMQNPWAILFNAGITAGLGSASHKYPDEFYNPKGVFAYNAGLFLQMHIGKFITLQPEAQFQSDGSKSPEGTFRRKSIVVPVNLHFNIMNEYNGLYKVFPFAGGYYLFSFNGKLGGNDIDFDESYSKNEWGLNFGLGFDVMDWQVKFTWRRALTNLSLEPDTKIFPAMWFLSVGYKL